MRDLYRPGSGMTLRRLNVLVDWLPPSARLWQSIEDAKKSPASVADRLRERQRHYEGGPA